MDGFNVAKTARFDGRREPDVVAKIRAALM